jgi:hypothetical protein
LPYDSVNPLFPFGHGLSYSGNEVAGDGALGIHAR